MLNWIVWNGTVFVIETVLTLNWTVWNRTDYLYKIGLALNNLQKLICHKTQPTNISLLILLIHDSYKNTKLRFNLLFGAFGFNFFNAIFSMNGRKEIILSVLN